MTRLHFSVALDPQLNLPSPNGRLFVVLGHEGSQNPRHQIGQTSPNAAPVFAVDLANLTADSPVTLDLQNAPIAPLKSIDDLPPGRYAVQAVLRTNRDSTDLEAEGNLYSTVENIELDPKQEASIQLTLSHKEPPEQLPADTPQVKHIKLKSELLTAFHHRPIYLRAGVILPRDHDRNPDRQYPLRVRIGGFGTRYTAVDRMMSPIASFRRNWNADDTPRFILLHLDGDGPLGDPYQVDSANHGPYGRALMEELIPHVERLYRGNGQRVTDGCSTGGWVSLALQVFYPDAFQGCWSSSPDPVDFRSYQLVNIYDDANAYVGPDGQDRASARNPATGMTRFTIREECTVENVLGQGGSYTRSGGQWGAWNATFSPRDAQGDPAPLWNPVTGQIDHKVAEQWKPYDLRQRLEADWPNLAPRLKGKIHVWVGEADDYFLEAAVHRLDAFLSQAQPAYGGSILFGPGKGHCAFGIDEPEMMRQMGAATGATP